MHQTTLEDVSGPPVRSLQCKKQQNHLRALDYGDYQDGERVEAGQPVVEYTVVDESEKEAVDTDELP